MQITTRSSAGFLLFLVPFVAVGQPPANAPKVVRLEHDGYRVQIVFSPDAKTLATGGENNQIRLWNVATGNTNGDTLCIAVTVPIVY